MFSLLKRKNTDIDDLYATIMDDARSPRLYTEFDVPDKPIGRFQMVALHAIPSFLVFARGEEPQKSQILFDRIFQDIEYSFREIGVGDLAVPKKMKRYMKDMNGMIQAHMADDANHVDIVRRNVFGDDGNMNGSFKKYIEELFDGV
jgi:cytochrome b pre-mRNA-processing protein 3